MKEQKNSSTGEKCLPFNVRGDPFYSRANIEQLYTSISDVEAGRVTLKEHALIEDDSFVTSGLSPATGGYLQRQT